MRFYINEIIDVKKVNEHLTPKDTIIGLFKECKYHGEGNFCGWYGAEFYDDTELYAFVIKYSNGVVSNIIQYSPAMKFESIQIKSHMVSRVIEVNSIGEAITLFRGVLSKEGLTVPDNMANEFIDGYTITEGDYSYTFSNELHGWCVRVRDTTLESYGEISTELEGFPTVSLKDCFNWCHRLIKPPTIPNTVVDIDSCFYGCAELIEAPVIPDRVTQLQFCFCNCLSLTEPPNIPDSVEDMYGCFEGCKRLKKAPIIPAGVKYMDTCFRKCESLTEPPTIPNSIVSMKDCFRGCSFKYNYKTRSVITESVNESNPINKLKQMVTE